jgi:hypothetical protein
LGRYGARHHGLGTGTHLDRSLGPQFPSALRKCLACRSLVNSGWIGDSSPSPAV